MLAQNFKTPAELGLEEMEFDALVKVLGMLERGELVHTPYSRPDGQNGFSLGTWKTTTHCGTVACIAGWCDHLFKTRFMRKQQSSAVRENLIELFTPQCVCQIDVTPEHAAIALRSFLTTGEPNWREAVRA